MPYCEEDYEALQGQLQALSRFQANPIVWEPLVEQLLEACDVPYLLLDNGLGRPQVPAVANKVVVRVDDLGARRTNLEQVLTDNGFNTEPEPEEDQRADQEAQAQPEILVFGSPADRPNLVGVVAGLDQLPGVEASPITLRPMNVVTKSRSGPEPTCCHPGDYDWEHNGSPGEDAGYVVVIDTGKALGGHANGWLTGVGGDDDPLTDGMYLLLSAGHGTAIAGIIRQICPQTRVDVMQLFDAQGFADDRALATAIRDAGLAIGEGHGVINLSVGDESYQDKIPFGVAKAIADLPERVIVVASAGNRPAGRPVYPAALSETMPDRVVSVASLDVEGNLSGWSNFGDWVTFSAIGEGVVTTFVAGEEKPGTGDPNDPHDPDPDTWVGPTPWALCTGTSFSAPQIAALLAKYLAANEGCSRQEAIDSLAVGGKIPGFGWPMTDTGPYLIFAKKP